MQFLLSLLTAWMEVKLAVRQETINKQSLDELAAVRNILNLVKIERVLLQLTQFIG